MHRICGSLPVSRAACTKRGRDREERVIAPRPVNSVPSFTGLLELRPARPLAALDFTNALQLIVRSTM